MHLLRKSLIFMSIDIRVSFSIDILVFVEVVSIDSSNIIGHYSGGVHPLFLESMVQFVFQFHGLSNNMLDFLVETIEFKGFSHIILIL